MPACVTDGKRWFPSNNYTVPIVLRCNDHCLLLTVDPAAAPGVSSNVTSPEKEDLIDKNLVLNLVQYQWEQIFFKS